MKYLTVLKIEFDTDQSVNQLKKKSHLRVFLLQSTFQDEVRLTTYIQHKHVSI